MFLQSLWELHALFSEGVYKPLMVHTFDHKSDVLKAHAHLLEDENPRMRALLVGSLNCYSSFQGEVLLPGLDSGLDWTLDSGLDS